MSAEHIVLTAHEGFVKAGVTPPDGRVGGFAYPTREAEDLDATDFRGVTSRERWMAVVRRDIAAYGDEVFGNGVLGPTNY